MEFLLEEGQARQIDKLTEPRPRTDTLEKRTLNLLVQVLTVSTVYNTVGNLTRVLVYCVTKEVEEGKQKDQQATGLELI